MDSVESNCDVMNQALSHIVTESIDDRYYIAGKSTFMIHEKSFFKLTKEEDNFVFSMQGLAKITSQNI
jgi:uncharacterized linocin/CFP29 family protein